MTDPRKIDVIIECTRCKKRKVLRCGDRIPRFGKCLYANKICTYQIIEIDVGRFIKEKDMPVEIPVGKKRDTYMRKDYERK